MVFDQVFTSKLCLFQILSHLDHVTLISEDRTKDVPSCSHHVLTDVQEAGDAEGARGCVDCSVPRLASSPGSVLLIPAPSPDTGHHGYLHNKHKHSGPPRDLAGNIQAD